MPPQSLRPRSCGHSRRRPQQSTNCPRLSSLIVFWITDLHHPHRITHQQECLSNLFEYPPQCLKRTLQRIDPVPLFELSLVKFWPSPSSTAVPSRATLHALISSATSSSMKPRSFAPVPHHLLPKSRRSWRAGLLRACWLRSQMRKRSGRTGKNTGLRVSLLEDMRLDGEVGHYLWCVWKRTILQNSKLKRMFGSGLEVNGGSFLPEMCCRSCRTDLGAEAFSSSLKSPFPIVFQRPRQCILGHSIGFCQHTQMPRNSRIRLRPQPNSNVEGKTDKGCPRDYWGLYVSFVCFSVPRIPFSYHTGAKKGRCGSFIPLAVYHTSWHISAILYVNQLACNRHWKPIFTFSQ